MEMKEVKQELQKLFDIIQESTQVGELPSLDDVHNFSRLSRRFLTFAEEEWMEECDDFVHIADQLLKSVKRGEVSDAILLVESISDARTFCHRTYGSGIVD